MFVVLAGMILYAWVEYGIAGGIFLGIVSLVILWMFFRALSTEALAEERQWMADCHEDDDSLDTVYNPMYSSLPQNIYHQD